jgi:ABC-2 type transport system permease protein
MTAAKPRLNRPSLFRNPVVIKELRGRMRGSRAFVILTVYLFLMSAFLGLLYAVAVSARDVYGFASGGQIGRTLFVGTVGIELFLVTFIAPAFTATAISGERERQTYDLLRTTLLPARALVMGKLVSALCYVLLLLLAALPLQSVAFFFGGVTEGEIILATLVLMVTAVLLGSVGVYISAISPRSLVANVTAYVFTFALTLLLPLLTLVFLAFFGPRMGQFPLEVQALCLYLFLVLVATNPLATALATQYWLIDKQNALFFTQPLTDYTTGLTTQVPMVSPWILFTLFYLLVSAIFVYRAVRRVRRIDAQAD